MNATPNKQTLADYFADMPQDELANFLLQCPSFIVPSFPHSDSLQFMLDVAKEEQDMRDEHEANEARREMERREESEGWNWKCAPAWNSWTHDGPM